MFIFDFIKCFFLGFYISFFSLLKYFLLGLFTVIVLPFKYFIIGIKLITKKEREKEYFGKIIFVLSFIVYLICVFLISRWVTQNIRIKNMSDDLINSTKIINSIPEENVISNDPNIVIDNPSIDIQPDTYVPSDYKNFKNISYLDVDFSKLLKQNNDTVGWLYVNDTNINYPFVQANNNQYYLSHSFDKSKNKAGWIFGDYRNNMNNMRKNTIIYGHNLMNENLFGTLTNVLKKEWYSKEDNLLIKLSSPNKNTIWKIFSIYTIKPEVYYLKTIFEDEEYNTFLKTIKDRSIYNFGDNLNIQDKILTLSTCYKTGRYRLLVHARLIASK